MAQVFTPDIIKKILIRLSRFTRTKPAEIGPITLLEIKKSFEEVLGEYPIDDASALLQRLVGLGRYESESDNRKFADTYILDGLRALDDAEIAKNEEKLPIFQEHWLNPVKKLGAKILSREIDSQGLTKKAIDYIKKANTSSNNIFISDILSGIIHLIPDCDLTNSTLTDGHLAEIDLSTDCPSGLTIRESVIESLRLGAKHIHNFTIEKCIINKIEGASSPQMLPDWIKETSVGEYSYLKNTAAVKDTNLNDNQKALLTILHKTFFQKGSARKEEALFRGLGALARDANFEKITSVLVAEGILEKAKGKEGFLYKPVRSHVARIREIVDKQGASGDTLWDKISKLR